jgi:hypothetical protein
LKFSETRTKYADTALESLNGLTQPELIAKAREVALPRFTMYNVGELRVLLSERLAVLKLCKEMVTYNLRSQVSNRITFTPYGRLFTFMLLKFYLVHVAAQELARNPDDTLAKKFLESLHPEDPSLNDDIHDLEEDAAAALEVGEQEVAEGNEAVAGEEVNEEELAYEIEVANFVIQ